MTTAFARLALSPLLADDAAAIAAETQLAASLEVRRYLGTETGAEAAARDERIRRENAAALVTLGKEARGEVERPQWRGPLQALRALFAWELDGVPYAPNPVWDMLPLPAWELRRGAEDETGRTESAHSQSTRLVDVGAAWEACLADGWELPGGAHLTAGRARAVVVFLTLGLPGAISPAQDPTPRSQGMWDAVRQAQPKARLRVWGRYDDTFKGGFQVGGEPSAAEVAAYASEHFECDVPAGHVVQLRRVGIVEFASRLQGHGLIPYSERKPTMAQEDQAFDFIGWKQVCAFLGVSENTARQWAERPTDPAPISVLNDGRGPVAAMRDRLVAWRDRELERGQKRPKAAAR